ncbi:MAG TPA: FAD-dependent thymidylate synthase [Thermomicrobiaceae bacterium]|nr:FAD-dependent thymidylate synthase [Thermomicrobiaceae bacterium]
MAMAERPPDRASNLNVHYPFVSSQPVVRLVGTESAEHPVGLTIAAAWSCYGGKPARASNAARLLDPAFDQPGDEVRPQRRARAERLYRDLFAAGHHTTFQHANFVFILDGVSRLAIWSFFHSHPYYNSEQVSQRYREVSGETVVTPELPEAELAIYREAVERALAGYRRLIELLTPDLTERYSRVFRARAKAAERGGEAAERVRADVQKKAQEVARYVLPLATPAHLYHTINGLTLLRYYALANQLDVPGEVRYLVNRMVDEVLKIDPNFLGAPGYHLDLDVIAPEETLEYQAVANLRANLDQTGNEAFFQEFDADLGDLDSKLVAYNPNAEHLLANAVRTVLGRGREELSDRDAIALVLDPARNHYLGHSLFLAMNSKLMQTLNHVPFTFQKRISGAEEAQNQRHRGTLSSSPILSAHLRPEPDVIVPYDVTRVPEAHEEYLATVQALWQAKNRLLDAGVPAEQVLYLLPNSHRVRFYETGTLLTYFWKWVKRLCFDAQREIFETARQETAQVAEVLPEIGRYVARPPCVLRAESDTTPRCPEGERYCGIPVWRDYNFSKLAERRVL